MKKAIRYILGKIRFKHSNIAFSARWDTHGKYGNDSIVFEKNTIIINSTIESNVSIEHDSTVFNSVINGFVTIHNNSKIIESEIGAYSYISFGTVVRNSKIGKFCSIGYNVKIGLGKHPTNYLSTNPIFYSNIKANHQISLSHESHFVETEPILIGNDVWIGAGAVINDGVKIGDGAIVAAGAVVVKDIEPYSIVGGIPAKIIRARFDNDTCETLIKSKWWDWPISKIKDEISLFQQPVDTLQDLKRKLD